MTDHTLIPVRGTQSLVESLNLAMQLSILRLSGFQFTLKSPSFLSALPQNSVVTLRGIQLLFKSVKLDILVLCQLLQLLLECTDMVGLLPDEAILLGRCLDSTDA